MSLAAMNLPSSIHNPFSACGPSLCCFQLKLRLYSCAASRWINSLALGAHAISSKRGSKKQSPLGIVIGSNTSRPACQRISAHLACGMWRKERRRFLNAVASASICCAPLTPSSRGLRPLPFDRVVATGCKLNSQPVHLSSCAQEAFSLIQSRFQPDCSIACNPFFHRSGQYKTAICPTSYLLAFGARTRAPTTKVVLKLNGATKIFCVSKANAGPTANALVRVRLFRAHFPLSTRNGRQIIV